MKNYLSPLFILLVVPIIGYADKQNIAFDVVACVNSTNGFPETLDKTPWELEQAVLEVPFDHEHVRLEPNYYFVGGRRLGWHGTWALLLALGDDEWVAFETRSKDDQLRVFAASFVPDKVVAALEVCSVEWGGFWTKEYPLIETIPKQQPIAPLFDSSELNVEDLLPPRPAD